MTQLVSHFSIGCLDLLSVGLVDLPQNVACSILRQHEKKLHPTDAAAMMTGTLSLVFHCEDCLDWSGQKQLTMVNLSDRATS